MKNFLSPSAAALFLKKFSEYLQKVRKKEIIKEKIRKKEIERIIPENRLDKNNN